MNVRELQVIAQKFADDRSWGAFHDPKNLAMALASEVGELCSVLRWVPNEMSDAAIHDRTVREQLQDEIGDVANLLLLLCSRTGIALEDAVIVKLEKNATKYPIDRTGGNADPPGHRMAGE